MRINEELFDGSLDIDPNLQRNQALAHLAALPACKGVILFSDSHGRPVQLLIAANMRRTARARLYTEDVDTPSKRPEIASIVTRIFYVCAYNDFNAALTHYNIAKNTWPGSYTDQISFPKLSLVKIDPSASWPAFSIVTSPSASDEEIVFGPFQSRRSATEFVTALENAFSLCHRPELVSNPAKAASCPYLQMEKCPAPCVGNIPRDQYQLQIEDAISAASGNADKLKCKLQEKMERYCGELKFEEANNIKNQIDQLELIARPSYKWTGRLEDLAVLHIDLSAKVKIKGKRKKTQMLAAYLITEASIHEFAPFDLVEIEQFHKSLSKELDAAALESGSGDRKTWIERIRLLCSFLYRSKPPGLWINCSENSGGQIPDADQLSYMIKKRFELEN